MSNITIIAHNGNFHADDVFAVATIMIAIKHSDVPAWRESVIKVLRTRDPEIIAAGDFVVDVGGVYDEENNRFDHHQEGGAGARENKIPYASFGLVWKKYGVKISGSEAAAESIERKIVMPIDGVDNGIDMFKPMFPPVMPYGIHDVLYSLFPTWKEKESNIDEIFMSAVDIARDLLQREIKRSQDNLEARALVEAAYHASINKKIIVLDVRYPAEALDILQQFKEPMFIVKPDEQNGTWKVATIRKASGSFKARRDLPEAWAGKRDKEFAEITGIADALFCHNKLFLAVAATKEGALELAKMALKH
jgi:uncharacterized UPF0160 family protein